MKLGQIVNIKGVCYRAYIEAETNTEADALKRLGSLLRYPASLNVVEDFKENTIEFYLEAPEAAPSKADGPSYFKTKLDYVAAKEVSTQQLIDAIKAIDDAFGDRGRDIMRELAGEIIARAKKNSKPETENLEPK